MTRAAKYLEDTPFCDWMRNNKRLPSSIVTRNDIDHLHVVHRHTTGMKRDIPTRHLMCIEEKTRGQRSLRAPDQAETLAILDCLLRNVYVFGCHGQLSGRNHQKSTPAYHTVKSFSGDYTGVVSWGVHLLTYDSWPSDIEWNGRRITTDLLEGILRFEINPFSMSAAKESDWIN